MTKKFIILFRTLALAGFFAGMDCVGDSLDEALNLQKKTAPRRIYSQPANLSDQNLLVPKNEIEEDRELDRKMEALEKELDRQAATTPARPLRMRPNAPTQMISPEENPNWLTPALLDEEAAMSTSEEDSWLAREVERQKQKKLEEQEEALLEKRMSEGVGPQDGFGQQRYDLPQRDLPTRNDFVRPDYLPPQRVQAPAPDAEESRNPIRPKNSSFFSRTDYTGDSAAQSPFSTALTPTERVDIGQPKRSATIEWESEAPKPRTPLERVRRSSIRDADPFSDDLMPEIETSIWD